MMPPSVIDHALRRIYSDIPREILELAFVPNQWRVSLDQRIKDTVVVGRVLSDCNIYAGKVIRIPLDARYLEHTRASAADISGSMALNHSVYRIPPEVREFRDITGIIDLTWPYAYAAYGSTPYNDRSVGNTLSNLSDMALSSRTQHNSNVTPVPILQAGNVILINPPNIYVNNWILVCRLGHDDEFTNVSNSSIGPLGELILAATKAYIYTNLIVKIDQAYLSGGQEVGVVKEIVQSYADANERYKDALVNFRGGAIFDQDVLKYLIMSAL